LSAAPAREEPSPRNTARLTEAQRVYLDFLRATAALAVLAGHAGKIFYPGGKLANSHSEMFGVLVFFLLSGFLISFSVFQKYHHPEYRFTEYFIERFCRIYCAFLPALAFVAFIDQWSKTSPIYLWRDQFNGVTALGNVLMLQEFPLFQIVRRLGVAHTVWFTHTFGSAGPFWTISIEWWIYMVFGAIVLIRLRSGKPFKPWQLLLVLLAAIEPAYHFVAGPDVCLTMLWVVGMLVSYSFWAHPARFSAAFWSLTETRWRRVCYVICAASLAAIVVHLYAASLHDVGAGVAEFQTGLLVASALFALFFACGAVHHVPKPLERVVAFIANYSYSLYLLHYSILICVKALMPEDQDARAFWIAIVASNITAIIFWYFFERHYRRLAAVLKRLISNRRLAPA
jgi:peptidoglycan/LPS O-acetylase OafA/YrhL